MVLVLESNDLPLSNFGVIARTVLEVEESIDERPDEVYLVETQHSEWTVVCVRKDDRSNFDNQIDHVWQVDSAKLVATTRR